MLARIVLVLIVLGDVVEMGIGRNLRTRKVRGGRVREMVWYVPSQGKPGNVQQKGYVIYIEEETASPATEKKPVNVPNRRRSGSASKRTSTRDQNNVINQKPVVPDRTRWFRDSVGKEKERGDAKPEKKNRFVAFWSSHEKIENDIVVPSRYSIPRSATYVIPNRLWPNGQVRYSLRGDVPRSVESLIMKAMEEIEEISCIRFYEDPMHRDRIEFSSEPTGCWSSIGFVGGKQRLNLQPSPECEKLSTVVHEIMHALGFIHEHQRPDRDEFIDIKLDQLQLDPSNLAIIRAALTQQSSKVKTYMSKYDCQSIMHYDITPSRRGKKCQTPSDTLLSELDIDTLNKVYKCKTRKSKKQPACQDLNYSICFMLSSMCAEERISSWCPSTCQIDDCKKPVA